MGWGTGGQDIPELATPPWTEEGLASGGPGPASHHAHFSGDLLAPTFRPAESRAPLSLPPGGQSSWWGAILGAGSSESRSLGLRPRFFTPARLFTSFLGTSDSWLLCFGGESAEVRNQFWGERKSAIEAWEAEATWKRSTRSTRSSTLASHSNITSPPLHLLSPSRHRPHDPWHRLCHPPLRGP